MIFFVVTGYLQVQHSSFFSIKLMSFWHVCQIAQILTQSLARSRFRFQAHSKAEDEIEIGTEAEANPFSCCMQLV